MTDSPSTPDLQNEIVELIPALRAFARSFHRNASDADDLVQETLAKALANLNQFDRGTRLKSWLFTIMRNTFCTKFRIARREAPGIKKCVSGAGVAPPSQEWAIRAKEMEEACNLLPEPYRVVLEYVVIEGRSYDAAAEKFGCAIGTVKSRLSRARQQLAAHLDEDRH
ncbi:MULTISPECIES: sigma-70 family RNA polymerase sigma factor [unclassified Rhizobium]|uniref:sigma-70 family RNA polymerase sigma factor n=1 Tax=Rhizobium TaxID=379 RepID=UPI00084CDB5A|nr:MULTISPECIES: sigma-70 family RNA polymerase sigma factor [unclassified Rhizobium]ASW09495.1 RNA polymerase subunit sigma [Rhizobium sp. 11515TR]MDK4716564.1 sigma-70 family RNA polymerase sigma factor [Rhizobium sp. CNPSo 4039]OEC94190.1 RNA polymerase subunit sigma [Rhizobium sp. YK2]QYA14777.1 sigma-70 family RNA polymerase sigma factor [Rhizobium sp. AB2/73]UEQ83234.1 sigma-70 family RNA polymerase sigma factor [Rhizobium sp. AB2/73]